MGNSTRGFRCLLIAVATDSTGHVFIGDTVNHRIRRVNALTGIITTVTGTGTNAVSGDSGLAIQAKLSGVTGIAVDTTGNVYFTSTNNQRVRKVRPVGIISTVAGGGVGGAGSPAT